MKERPILFSGARGSDDEGSSVMNMPSEQAKKFPAFVACQPAGKYINIGASVMKSVSEFNDDQRENFRLIANDVLGPTMLSYVLETLEKVAWSVAQPDIGPAWIEVETQEKFEVCMAALEYFRMHMAANNKG